MAQQDVEASRGALQVAAGLFDLNLRATLSEVGATTPQSPDTVTYNQGILNSYIQAGQLASGITAQSSSTSYTTNWMVGLAQQFRWGMSITPSVSLSFVNPQNIGYFYPNLATVPANTGTATVNFRLVQPLLRGRGAEATAAAEIAAKSAVDVAMYQLRQTVATSIQEVASDYWDYVAAYRVITILQQAEERAGLLLKNEEQLVASGEHPPAELKKLEANLASATTARLSAERSLVQVRRSLGLAMGLRWQEITTLAAPSDELASIAEDSLPSPEAIARLIEHACRQRPDRLAQVAALRSAGALTRGAQRGLDPQLDLELDLGYSGLSQAAGATPLITPLADGIGGVNFTGQLSFSYPTRNNAARGALKQREAAMKRAELSLQDLERHVGANVALTVAELRSELQVWKTAETTAQSYRAAAVNEQKRLRAGLSTIFDVLLTQDRLTSAEIGVLQQRSLIAKSLVKLRYETGTLLDSGSTDYRLSLAHLTSVPSPP